MCACAIFVKQCTTSNHSLESRRSAIHFRNSLLPHYYSVQDSLDSSVQHIMERLEMKRRPQKLGFTSVVDCNTQRSIYYFSICITLQSKIYGMVLHASWYMVYSRSQRYMGNDEIWYTIWSWTFSEIAASHKEFIPITHQIQLGRLSTYGLQYKKCFTSIQYSKGATAGTPFTQNHTTRSRSQNNIQNAGIEQRNGGDQSTVLKN